MIIRASKHLALWVITLMAVVVLLPLASLAATQPKVTVLSPLAQGLRSPVNIALDAAGNIYVADQRIRGIVKFDTFGAQQAVIPVTDTPNGIAFSVDGTLLVSQGTAVVRYNVETGQEVGRLDGGDLQRPAGIAVDDVTGFIYVADSVANQMVVYSAAGLYTKSFAKGVSADAAGKTVVNPLGKLSMPTGVTFEKVSRQIAVADTLSNRIQFFDTDGNFVKSIGIPLPTSTGGFPVTTMMQFVMPVAVAFEYSKNASPVVLERIYIADLNQNNIQVVDPATSAALLVSGTTKNYIGSSGMLNGQLMTPSDMAFDGVNNRLMVVSSIGNVTLYGVDGGLNPLDTVPPALTVDPVPATVTLSSLTISGTVEAGAKVAVVVAGDTVAGGVVYTSSTTWKSEITGLAEGENSISIGAADAAGNQAPLQSIRVTYLQKTTEVSLSSVLPALTNSQDFEVSGTVTEGAKVTLTNDSNSVSETAVVDGVKWTARVKLAEGANSFTIVAEKPMSINGTVVLYIALDSTAPALNVSALSDGSYTNSGSLNVSGTVSDANGFSVVLNDKPVDVKDGSFNVLVDLAVNGSNSIIVTATDAAGNVSQDIRNITLDVNAPVVAVVSPVDNSSTNLAQLNVTGSSDEVVNVTVQGVPAIFTDSNWTSPLTLVEGQNTIEIVATDLAGNTSSYKRSIMFEPIRPTLAIVTPKEDLRFNQLSMSVSGTVDRDISSLTAKVKDTVTPVTLDNGNFTLTVNFATEDVYPVVLTATNAAGYTTTVTRNITFDKTPPLLTLDAVKWQAQALGGKLGGTVEAGSTVTVNEGALPIGKTVVEGDRWSADLTGTSYNQTKLSVVAIDAAGNTTTKMLKTNGK